MPFVTNEDLNERLRTVEERFYEMGFDFKRIVQSEVKRSWKINPQAETNFGLFLATCVETADPLSRNRIRFYSPLLHNSDTPLKSLPWAYPVSSMGGFDGSGLSWVPPAGSTVAIMFEAGNKETAFYLGTIWHGNRGPDGQHIWDFAAMDEYYKVHEGHRKGYLVGANDGSQVLPPWNTENFNNYDFNTLVDFNRDPEAKRKSTVPNIFGFVTPQKAGMKITDGNYKCNHKHKRLEIISSCGNYILLKDDHIHNTGWGHPSCGSGGSDISDCNDSEGNPVEQLDCSGQTSNSSVLGGHPGKDNKTYNPYFKNENECRPIKGPGTPQNNKYALEQSGIQFLSIAGHSFVMDDSVEEPQGIPEWEKSTEDFDFGCSDKFTGKISIKSATGHTIEMSDKEEETEIRGEDNYIRLLTASGIKLELNDHTVNDEIAGEKRGVTIQTTSNHTFEMLDEENEQASPPRKEGGTPVAKAKKGVVRMRTGYGLEFTMADESSQEETDEQNIQIFCPQKDNSERGPHIMRFQEKKDGPGQVFLKVGGDYICYTHDNHMTIVGDVENNPSDKITSVSGNTVIQSKEAYYNQADIHVLESEQAILLMAGKECKPIDPEDGCQPCVWPVLCLSPKGITISDRVFVSASPDAGCASVFHLLPFHSCEDFERC